MADNKTQITLTAVDQTGAALKSAQAGLSNLGTEATKVTGILSGFAALAGATAFAGLIKGAIDSAESLHDLAQQSGASVEALSGMKSIAKLAGADMEQVAAGLGKLSKNMVEAAQGSGKAGEVLQALGVSVKNSSGNLKTSDQVMVEFAKSLQGIGNASERAAAAQLVLGKSGAQLLPFLNDLAVAGDLQVKVTAAQAAAADNLNDNITRLSLVQKAWVNTVAMEVVPVADTFVQALLDMAKETNQTKKAAEDLSSDGSIQQWAIDSAKAVGFLVDEMQLVGKIAIEIATPFERLARNVKTLGAMGSIMTSGESLAVRQQAYLDLENQNKEFYASLDKRLANNRADSPLFSEVLDARLSGVKQKLEAFKVQAAEVEKIYKQAGFSAEVADKAIKSLYKGMMNDGDSSPSVNNKRLTDLLRDQGDTAAKAAHAIETLHNAQMALATKQAAAELDAIAKAQEDYSKAVNSALEPLEKQAQALEREVETYGQTESAIQSTLVARLEEARAIAQANGAWDEHLNYLDREIDARKRIAGAAGQKEYLDTNKRAAEAASREWEKVGDDINRALTDALMRGFEDGKSFGQNFVDSLKASLKTLVLRVVVNMATEAGGGLITSGLNSLLGTSGANGGSGVNYLGLANNAQSLYTAYGAASQLFTGASVGASSASLVYANGVGMVGGDSIGALYAANGGWSGVSTGAAGGSTAAGGSAAGGSSGAAAGVSSIAWIAAIVAGMWMSSEAWKAGIRWENYAAQKDVAMWDAEVNIRRAHDEPARAIFGDGFVDSQFYAIMGGGSLSAQIHYGIQNALFGSKRVTGTQTTGTFSEADQGFSGLYGVNMKKSGGLFSSSREWTNWHGLPAQVDTIMDTLYRGVRNSFIMLGETFDDTSLAAKLADFTMQFNVASTDMATIANAASTNLSIAIGNILTPSVSALMKSGETWTGAFERILAETNSVNRVMELMGKSMLQAFGQNNLDGILKASDNLVTLFGSIDNFNSAFSAYFANFYTGQEQAAQGWRDVGKVFAGMNRTMPTTRQGFRDLVDSLDLNTDAGRNALQTLMSVQGAFAALTPTLEDAASAAGAFAQASQDMQATQIGAFYAAQRKAQQSAISAQMNEASVAAAGASSLIESFKNISSSLGSYRDSLRAGSDTAASPFARYDAARAQYQITAASARLGNVDAAGNLQGMADAFLQASRDVGTSGQYAADVAGVIATIDAVVSVADRQIPIAEAQLTVANQQLTTLQAILDQLSGNQAPAVVANYQQAATDWVQFFAGTSIGASVQTAAGTMQRISQSMGLLIDPSGNGYTFNQNDNPYTLAGISDSYRQYMLAKYGAWNGASFASGGLHSGGLRLVGENGPELEFTGPSRIINATDTASLLGGGGMADVMAALLREIAELRAEVRSGQAALIQNTGKTARTLDKFDIDGLPEVRAA